MASVETALTVCQRIRGSTHLTKVIVCSLMQSADHLQIEIQNFIKICVLCTGFCQDHRKMQADRTDVETTDKDRHIVFICRFHTATLIPRT